MLTSENQQVLPNHKPTLHRNWVTDIVFLTLGIGIFYILFLGHYALFTPDEGRYSEVAREMVATGDYITPRVNGVAFLDKPILYYWLQATAIHLFGVNEWALRLFPALFGVFGCLITYTCGRRLFDRRTGILSALILATTPLYFACAHYANLDLEVAVLISSALLCYITAILRSDRLHTPMLIAAYLFAGLAVLTKGLIGIVFPGIIISIWMLLTWRFKLLLQMRLITGTILILAITLPWYILVQKANPGFLHYFFVTQHVTRFLSGADFNNKMPFWFYGPVILLGFLPWTLFIIQTFNHHIRAIWQNKKEQQGTLFLLIWFTFVLCFFSFPHSKLVSYILPVFPPLALLTGRYLSLRWDISPKLAIIFKTCAAISALFLISLIYNAERLNTNSVKPLALQLKTLIKPTDETAVYFRYFQDVPLYLGNRVTIVADWNAHDIERKDNWVREFWYSMPFQDTSSWLINETEFWKRWNSEKRLFVFVSDNYLNQFKSHTKKFHIIGEYNDVFLLSNQP